jgi:hypothetical protein
MPKKDSDENALKVIKEQESAAQLRGHLESNWEQIALRVLPNYANQFGNQNRTTLTKGEQNTHEMVDSTAALALTRFAAAMESMLTPRNSTWHQAIPSDEYLLKDRAVRLWFDDLTRALFRHRYAPKANFASQKHEDYVMLGAFGTGTIYTDALQGMRGEKGLRYSACHLGQMYFFENHQGIIDRQYRRFPFTTEQAVERFGLENLPEVFSAEITKPDAHTKEHWFIHKVAPRDAAKYDPERLDVDGMEFYSCYVSLTGKCTVEEGGYHTNPYSISRYVTTPGETYGRSPAMFALPSIKTLNEMKKTVLKQGHRTVDPVLLAHDDGIVDTFSMRPGAVNPGGVNAEGRPLVHALPTGNIAIGDKLMAIEQHVINDWFLVTLFQILVESPQMTATEVIERAREKGALLSPTMGRQQSESLGPMIDREIDLLVRQRLVPPMPPALLEAKGEYTVRYDSPLSRMARAEHAAGFLRTMEYCTNYVQLTGDASPLDNFNMDVAIPELADIQAVPTKWMESPAGIANKRKQRAQAAQQQAMAEMAPAASSVMKTVLPKPK